MSRIFGSSSPWQANVFLGQQGRAIDWSALSNEIKAMREKIASLPKPASDILLEEWALCEKMKADTDAWIAASPGVSYDGEKLWRGYRECRLNVEKRIEAVERGEAIKREQAPFPPPALPGAAAPSEIPISSEPVGKSSLVPAMATVGGIAALIALIR